MVHNLEQIIYDKENLLLRPEVRNSRDKLEELLSDGFIEFGSSGVIHTKSDILERLPKTDHQPIFEIRDFITKELSDNVVLATYRVIKKTEAEEAQSLRSSIWKNVNNKWVMVFHQGTTSQ